MRASSPGILHGAELFDRVLIAYPANALPRQIFERPLLRYGQMSLGDGYPQPAPAGLECVSDRGKQAGLGNVNPHTAGLFLCLKCVTTIGKKSGLGGFHEEQPGTA